MLKFPFAFLTDAFQAILEVLYSHLVPSDWDSGLPAAEATVGFRLSGRELMGVSLQSSSPGFLRSLSRAAETRYLRRARLERGKQLSPNLC